MTDVPRELDNKLPTGVGEVILKFTNTYNELIVEWSGLSPKFGNTSKEDFLQEKEKFSSKALVAMSKTLEKNPDEDIKAAKNYLECTLDSMYNVTKRDLVNNSPVNQRILQFTKKLQDCTELRRDLYHIINGWIKTLETGLSDEPEASQYLSSLKWWENWFKSINERLSRINNDVPYKMSPHVSHAMNARYSNPQYNEQRSGTHYIDNITMGSEKCPRCRSPLSYESVHTFTDNKATIVCTRCKYTVNLNR